MYRAECKKTKLSIDKTEWISKPHYLHIFNNITSMTMETLTPSRQAAVCSGEVSEFTRDKTRLIGVGAARYALIASLALAYLAK